MASSEWAGAGSACGAVGCRGARRQRHTLRCGRGQGEGAGGAGQRAVQQREGEGGGVREATPRSAAPRARGALRGVRGRAVRAR